MKSESSRKVHAGPARPGLFRDYSADIALGDDKFLVVTASMPAPKTGGNSYLSLTLDDGANPVDLGEVKISDDMFREITGAQVMKRPDFLYTCECGYYVCEDCGTPWYPMEIEPNEETGESQCPDCGGCLSERKTKPIGESEAERRGWAACLAALKDYPGIYIDDRCFKWLEDHADRYVEDVYYAEES